MARRRKGAGAGASHRKGSDGAQPGARHELAAKLQPPRPRAYVDPVRFGAIKHEPQRRGEGHRIQPRRFISHGGRDRDADVGGEALLLDPGGQEATEFTGSVGGPVLSPCGKAGPDRNRGRGYLGLGAIGGQRYS